MTLTAEEMTDEDRTTAGRTIHVDDRGGKTMTRHRMGYQGVLKFRNWSDKPLVITASACQPFKLPGCSDAAAEFTVPPETELSVTIHECFSADEFAYSARIADSEPEDPIVIIDRR